MDASFERHGRMGQPRGHRLITLRHARSSQVFVVLFLIAAAGLYINHQQHAQLRRSHTPSNERAYCALRIEETGAQPGDQFFKARQELYTSIGLDFERKGLQLGGAITQGLAQSDLFTFAKDAATGQLLPVPVLRPLDVSVRAIIIPVSDAAVSRKLRSALQAHLVPLVPASLLWLQNHSMYHSTVLHASSHVNPVAAAAEDVQLEVEAVQLVAAATCPVKAVLDRIAATSTGVLMACWQVLPAGCEPAILRAALQGALPNPPPPEAQMVKQPVILHTTIARLLQAPSSRGVQGGGMAASTLAAAARRMTQELCGTVAVLKQLLFVEELDLLALALNGRFRVLAAAPLQCETRSMPSAVT